MNETLHVTLCIQIIARFQITECLQYTVHGCADGVSAHQLAKHGHDALKAVQVPHRVEDLAQHAGGLELREGVVLHDAVKELTALAELCDLPPQV